MLQNNIFSKDIQYLNRMEECGLYPLRQMPMRMREIEARIRDKKEK